MNALTTAPPVSLPVLPDKNYSPAINRFNVWNKGRPVTEEAVKEFFRVHTGEFSANTLQLWKVAIKAAILKASPTHDTRVLAAMRETFRGLKVPKPEKRLHTEDVFTAKEIRAIIRVVQPNIGFFIRALYDSGARVSELASVRLAKCTVQGRAVKCRITGKGGRERDLTLDFVLFNRIKKKFSGKVYLFERTKGRPYCRKNVWHHINRAALAALGRRAHPHQMRHSRITHILDSKIPLSAASRFAGHRKPETTLAYYAHNEMSNEQVMEGKL